MDRREFLSTLVAGVSVNAAVRTWPFRVFSFPTELRIFSMEELRRIYVERAMAEISRDMTDSPLNGGASILCSLPPDLESLGSINRAIVLRHNETPQLPLWLARCAFGSESSILHS